MTAGAIVNSTAAGPNSTVSRGGPTSVGSPAAAAGAPLEAVRRVALDLIAAADAPLRRLTVRYGRASVELEWPGQPAVAIGAADANGANSAGAAGDPPPDAAADPALHQVRAPIVGTFYRAPEPGAPPFVAVGDTVDAGQQVGIVEAMKLMNPIEADRAGRVTAVLVPDGGPVEYDQPLLSLARLDVG